MWHMNLYCIPPQTTPVRLSVDVHDTTSKVGGYSFTLSHVRIHQFAQNIFKKCLTFT